MTPDRHRLRNVVNLSRREIDVRQPSRYIDLVHRVCPVIHTPRDANNNTVLRQVKQGILTEPDKTRMVAVEPDGRTCRPHNLPR